MAWKLKPANTKRMARLRVSLNEIRPEIWREVDVCTSMTLVELHLVIQGLFEWVNYHLYDFELFGKVFDCEDAAVDALTLESVWAAGVRDFGYRYDFGDNWRHAVKVLAVWEGISQDASPRFVDGGGAVPPEDVGGVEGFSRFLEAMTKPRHPEKRDYKRWYGKVFDPEKVPVRLITARMALMQALGIKQAWDVAVDAMLEGNVQVQRWAERDKQLAQERSESSQ